MSRRSPPPRESSVLRKRAEERIDRRKPEPADLDANEAGRLVHEVEVHQIELEIQTEELRGARAETERSLARYTEVFDFAPIPYAVLGATGTIQTVNHAGARLLKTNRSALTGVRFAAHVAGPDHGALAALLAQARESEKKESCEVMLAGRGPARHVRLTAAALAGAEPTILLAFEDITERKEREAELARTAEALREADRHKDEFLAVLSHELRNPLAPIRNSLFVLAHVEPGSAEARKAQAVIDRQVSHLTRLVGDLLDVNRIRLGKLRLQRERTELGDLVRRTMEDHRASFEASAIGLERRFDPGLFWVQADPSRMIQALSNLLGNAEKFTQRGGRVIVSLQRDDARVLLRVRDTGVGIAGALLPHVFEPFAQAPQSNDRSRGGLGLGLAMVKGLVQLHDGTVSITSDGPGHGTEVTIALPLETAAARPAALSEPLPSRSRRVLVIEDNADAADSLRDALTVLGHVVEVAYDGPGGLALARSFRPEIAICDIGLPSMDGYAVARAFRAEPALHGVYLVALSGYAQTEDRHRAGQAGFDRHVAKPAALDKLERVLAEAPVGKAGAGASPSPKTVS